MHYAYRSVRIVPFPVVLCFCRYHYRRIKTIIQSRVPDSSWNLFRSPYQPVRVTEATYFLAKYDNINGWNIPIYVIT